MKNLPIQGGNKLGYHKMRKNKNKQFKRTQTPVTKNNKNIKLHNIEKECDIDHSMKIKIGTYMVDIPLLRN